MKPEDVPLHLAEKAAEAIYHSVGEPMLDCCWDYLVSQCDHSPGSHGYNVIRQVRREARHALAAVLPLAVAEEREAIARGCDDAAEAEEHLAALAEKDGDRHGAQIHRVAAQENRQTASAIRSRGWPR